MDWTAESLSILLTGVLFMGIVCAGLSPLVTLTPMSFGVFGAAGVVFVVAAFALARVQEVNYPPLMWTLPILPLLIIGVLCKDAVAARRVSSQTVHATAIARPDAERPLAAPEEAPAMAQEPFRSGEGSAHALVTSAHVTPNQLAHMAINNPELRPLIARNPLTPPSVLEWLAEGGSPEAASAIEQRKSAKTLA